MTQRILDVLRERTRMSFPVEEGEETYDAILAVCALFLELASADGEFGNEERKRILTIFRNEFQMFTGDIEELMNLAEEELGKVKDKMEFTKAINKHYSTEERMGLARLLWKVVMADENVGKDEEALLEKIARELDISPRKLKKARDKAEDSE